MSGRRRSQVAARSGSGRSRHRRDRRPRRGPLFAVTGIGLVGVVTAVAGIATMPTGPGPVSAAVPARYGAPTPSDVSAAPAPVETPRPSATAPPPTTSPDRKPPPTRSGPRLVIAPNGNGRFVIAPAPAAPPPGRRLVRYRVEVEHGLPFTVQQVAAVVDATLADKRSWRSDGYRFRRTDTSAEIRILLATPGTTDRLCAPLDTGGEVSCRNKQLVVLNAKRWAFSSAAFGPDVPAYRQYVVNHEVGHALGHGHEDCPKAGRLAPVMMQQTLGLGGCRPNPWPAP